MNTLDIRALHKLRERLVEDLQAAHEHLGSGKQIVPDDAAATGMRCVKWMGLIEGLTAAMTHIKQINDEMNGKKGSD